MFWPSIDLILPGEKAPEIAAVPVPGTGEPTPVWLPPWQSRHEALEPEEARRASGPWRAVRTCRQRGEEMAGLSAEAYPADDEVDPRGLGSER